MNSSFESTKPRLRGAWVGLCTVLVGVACGCVVGVAFIEAFMTAFRKASTCAVYIRWCGAGVAAGIVGGLG